ncbi:MAG: hypothetical protein HY298_02495 [Verrucomicrobia bacterium]|nr:hypothetical protein [Verrucomicrobiota bacterium]
MDLLGGWIIWHSMFSSFKKRQTSPELTFKARVERFWEWYAEVAERFYRTIENGKCSDLAAEVSNNVDDILPGFAWVFGPGAGGVGHSFTLSGEGVLHRQLLAIHCVSRAPKLNGWTFYPARQPGSIEGVQMEIGRHKFDPMEFWLTPTINNEAEKVDITVWHPLFERLREEGERLGTLFLFLDEVLGEFGTGQWIGEIKLNDPRLSDAIPLKELHEFIKKVESETGWKKLPPGQEGVVYRCEEQHDRFPRGDVVVGKTTHIELINEYLEAKGELQDPLAGTGADYIFVSFDVHLLPEGEQSAARGTIEDALEDALKAAYSGRLLGGAHGRKSAYIDLLIFDGTSSLEIVQRVLHEKKLPAGTAINFFAKEKTAQRIIL